MQVTAAGRVFDQIQAYLVHRLEWKLTSLIFYLLPIVVQLTFHELLQLPTTPLSSTTGLPHLGSPSDHLRPLHSPKSLLHHAGIMPDSYGQSQSNNPNALKISHDLYSFEKATFAGFLLSSIFYGTHEGRTHMHTHPCSLRLFDFSRGRHRAFIPMYDGAF